MKLFPQGLTTHVFAHFHIEIATQTPISTPWVLDNPVRSAILIQSIPNSQHSMVHSLHIPFQGFYFEKIQVPLFIWHKVRRHACTLRHLRYSKHPVFSCRIWYMQSRTKWNRIYSTMQNFKSRSYPPGCSYTLTTLLHHMKFYTLKCNQNVSSIVATPAIILVAYNQLSHS